LLDQIDRVIEIEIEPLLSAREIQRDVELKNWLREFADLE
jgi:hypothetical protein